MPNIGALLKGEIVRLARREVRGQVETLKKATALHRRDIALLKRDLLESRRQVTRLERQLAGLSDAAPAESAEKRTRFVAKGLRSQRNRLGLSAAEFGRLAGVSAQSVYNWERGLAIPREEQRATLAGLRGIGKRDAAARLQQLDTKAARTRRKA